MTSLIGNRDGFMVCAAGDTTRERREAYADLRKLEPEFRREFFDRTKADLAAKRASEITGRKFYACEALL